MEACRMVFDGRLLKRGFWLYVWDIKEEGKRHLYVGRTGDSSSPNASSPFRRIGQHLDFKWNAKGNALNRRLREEGLNPEACTFEMIAIGPLFDEQQTMEEHRPLRDKTAAMERALADELKQRGYHVLGKHPRAGKLDDELFKQVVAELQTAFPSRHDNVADGLHFKPVPLRRPGISVSEIIIQERGEVAT